MTYEYQIKFWEWKGEYTANVTGLQPSLERELRKNCTIEIVPFMGKKLTLKKETADKLPIEIQICGTMKSNTKTLSTKMNRNLFFRSDSSIIKIK